MTRFASPRHLASWAGQCPGNDQSAGKRRSGKTRNGSKWLNFALKEAAMAAIRVKANYPAAQYQRLKPRRGSQARAGRRQALTDQRDLAHALHRRDLPRPRPRLLHQPRPRTPDHAPRQTARNASDTTSPSKRPRQPERTFPARQLQQRAEAPSSVFVRCSSGVSGLALTKNRPEAAPLLARRP